MRKRFLLEGEQNGSPIWIGVAFKDGEVSVFLHLFLKKEVSKEALQAWVRTGKDMPEAMQLIERSVGDENLLPEDIKVVNVGKVRDIEIEWADNLMQTRMMQGFAGELNLLKDKVSALEDYSQEVFDACSSFWERLLAFKKEQISLSNEIMDAYKQDLDILFEALKALRQDFKKEKILKARETKLSLLGTLDKVEKDLKGGLGAKAGIAQLKKARTTLNDAGLSKAHYEEVHTRINDLFASLSEIKNKVEDGKTNKRISDLEEISAKMQKSLEWDERELAKEQKNRERSEQIFQVKLLDAKIEMIQQRVVEKREKLENILSTLKSLKKKQA
ncbi:MAG: hypothetical protein H6579_09015 [Chitinophagales bacterium]|nr:hypothetical protein [Chitinophagales bacterium]